MNKMIAKEENKEIGANIRKYRKACGFTQKALSDETGIAEITIRQYEAGYYAPKHDSFKKLADALGVGLSDLAPDIYPVGFKTPEEFEQAWEQLGGGKHPNRTAESDKHRTAALTRIEENESKLNDAGIDKLAAYSDFLVGEPDYNKE